jgi:hypothetical protein
MANYMLLTSEEKLFIQVQTTCEHSGEYYVTTTCRLRINLLGSHARPTVFGIKYYWPICYMFHTYLRRPTWAYYCPARLHLTSRTPRPGKGQINNALSNKQTNKQLEQTTVLLEVVVWVNYFNWPMSLVTPRRSSNELVSLRRVGYTVYNTRADKKWQRMPVRQNTAPLFKSNCKFIVY